MKNEKILVPSFSTEGYSVNDAREKNATGLCCMETCDNSLDDTENYYMGLLACSNCHGIIMKGLEEWREADQRRLDVYIVEYLSHRLAGEDNEV